MSVRELERQLDTYYAESLSVYGIESILDSMPLGNYEDNYNSRYNSFRNEWSEYVNGWN